jgi:hypothetical protein
MIGETPIEKRWVRETSASVAMFVLKCMRSCDDTAVTGVTSQACSIERESDVETNIMNVGSCR